MEKKITLTNKIRITLFRKQIEEQNLTYLKDKTDEELFVLLNATVMPNAMELNTLKYTVFFHLLFQENKEKKLKTINNIKKIIALEETLTKVDKMIMKFGMIHGFKSYNYRTELHRYINTPLNIRKETNGRKFISSYKFKEIFQFSYSFLKRAKKNMALPKF